MPFDLVLKLLPKNIHNVSREKNFFFFFAHKSQELVFVLTKGCYNIKLHT